MAKTAAEFLPDGVWVEGILRKRDTRKAFWRLSGHPALESGPAVSSFYTVFTVVTFTRTIVRVTQFSGNGWKRTTLYISALPETKVLETSRCYHHQDVTLDQHPYNEINRENQNTLVCWLWRGEGWGLSLLLVLQVL